jgi:hypothetical protein
MLKRYCFGFAKRICSLAFELMPKNDPATLIRYNGVCALQCAKTKLQYLCFNDSCAALKKKVDQLP